MISLDIQWDRPETPIAEALLQKTALACGQAEGISLDAYAQVRVTGDDEIHEINREYRGIDRATDVLSFPSTDCHPGDTLGRHPEKLRREMDESGRCFLGDVIISLPRAREQAAEYGHSLERELCYLAAHSLFHLMGYDHMRPEDKTAMRAMEHKALCRAGVSRVPDRELIAQAKAAMEYSYSPYSHFRVGAALLTDDDRVFLGCNIENASYGVTNCAERTALFKAVSEGARRFSAIAIAAEKAMPWPCGVCRQALYEFAPDLRVIVCCGEETAETTLSALLPRGFGPADGLTEILGKE